MDWFLAGGGKGDGLFPRPFAFAHDILRALVGSEAEVDGLAQFALARPFRELNLGYERRPDPSGHEFVLHLAGEGRLRDFQLHELAVQLFQG
jgi:hypothetical protein